MYNMLKPSLAKLGLLLFSLVSSFHSTRPKKKSTLSVSLSHKMPTLTKLFSMQEISQHNTQQDCWIVIDGKVYDVSSYLDEHPGGDDVVLAATAKDATDDFEDAGHSQEARELLQKFCIGELDTSSTVIPQLEISTKKHEIGFAEKLQDLTKQYWIVPVAIVGISVLASFVHIRKK